VQFLRQSDEVLYWINEKIALVSADEFGHDLEHVEIFQKNFDEFQKDMSIQVISGISKQNPGLARLHKEFLAPGQSGSAQFDAVGQG